MDTIWLWTTAGWREYVDIGYSDYSGGTVARSNVDTFEAMEDVEWAGTTAETGRRERMVPPVNLEFRKRCAS